MSALVRPSVPGFVHGLGRLTRIALFPTAVADVAAGIVLGAGQWPQGAGPFLLMGASSCIYHGGVALNDWADRDADATERPERPIPSGTVPADVALLVALSLMPLGVVLAFCAAASVGASPQSVGSAALLSTAALLALAYDLGPRGPRLGPALIGTCRALDLAAGLVLGMALSNGDREEWVGIVAVLAYGVYVYQVGRLGRLEDREDVPDAELGDRPSRLLSRIALALALVGMLAVLRAVGVEGRLPRPLEILPLLPAAAGAAGLLRVSRQTHWTTRDVVSAMGGALRRLLVFTATCALLAGTRDGAIVAAFILFGYPLSYALRRAFPPS